MGKLAEVNQSTSIGLKLFDGATDQFPRARIYDAAGTELTAAPFNSPINLTHRANGFYSASFTPNVEGELFIVYRVFSENTYTTLNKKYEEVMETMSVRSVDQDLATLLSRLTAGRATNLDNLDATISSRQSAATALSQYNALVAEHDATQLAVAAVNADTDDIQAKIGTPVGTVSSDIAGIQTKLGTPAGASVSADIASVKSDTSGLRTDYTTVRAAKLDNLDVVLSTRLSTAAFDTKIGTPAGASVSVDIAAVKSDTVAIKAKTDQLIFTSGRVDAVISAAQEAAIVDQVWDESLAAHVVAGSMGFNQNLLDDIYADTDSLDTTKITPTRASNLDNLDATVSSRATQASLTLVGSDVTAIKAKTDQITFTGGLVDSIAQTVADKTGYELTVSERSAIATEVEAHLLNEGDGQMIINAIVAAIGNQNVDEIALVAAIRADLERVGGFSDQIKAKTDQLAFSGGRVNSVISTTQEDAIVDKVWDESLAGHAIAGSAGKTLSDVGAAAASPAVIADAVWDELMSGHLISGSFGANVNRIDDIETKVDTINTKADQIITSTNSVSIAQAVWNAARASYNLAGSFGEGSQGVLTTVRATLLDNLVNLDVLVSTRADVTQANAIIGYVDELETRLTAVRAAKLDLIDVAVSSRASAAAVAALPTAADMADAVWDESLAAHSLPGSTGLALSTASAVSDPNAIRDAVWNATKASYVTPGTFGALLDVAISTRASQLSLDDAKGAGFATGTDSLKEIRAKLNTLPTSAGDATIANQNAILSAISSKASQASVNSLSLQVAAIPTNPLLTTDVRLNNLDAAISTRLSQTAFDVIKGAGWSGATDTLKGIKDAVDAGLNLTPVLSELSAIKGAGFNGTTDSLEKIRDTVDLAKTSADNAATAANAAAAAVATKADQATLLAVQVAVGNIPTNPVLVTDPRLSFLDASISSRASAAVLASIMGGTFNPVTDSLEAIRDAIPVVTGYALETSVQAAISAINTRASSTALSALGSQVAAIPTNPALVTDPRLNNLDALISSRATDSDIQLIKGGGFVTADHSLVAIKAAAAVPPIDVTPVMNELADIKGAGFTTTVDALKPLNDTAKVERAQIKGDTEALLGTGEGF